MRRTVGPMTIGMVAMAGLTAALSLQNLAFALIGHDLDVPGQDFLILRQLRLDLGRDHRIADGLARCRTVFRRLLRLSVCSDRRQETADEETRLGQELGQILQHVAALERLDTSGIEPLAHALEVVNVVREDGISNRPDREALLANAPATEAGFFAVPKIIE